MAETLFLLKASRIRDYFHQNLAIMAAPEGDSFEISYSDRWIQPGLAVEVGNGCAIVMADSPYTSYAPIRWGVVEQSERTERGLKLRVRLGAFVLGGSTLTDIWNADGQLDLDEGRSADKKRPYFLFSELNPGLRNPSSWAEKDQAWHEAIDRLEDNGFFAGSTLARISSVVANELELTEDAEIPAGTELTVEVETRSIHLDETTRSVALETTPPGFASLVEDEPVAATGQTEIKVATSGTGPFELRLNFVPDPLRSSRPSHRLVLSGDASGPTSPPQMQTSGGDVERLVRQLKRVATVDDRAWIALLEDFFVPWSGGHDRLQSTLAEELVKVGDFEKAVHVLRRIDGLTPDDELLLLVASITTGADADYNEMIMRAELSDASSFEQLVTALESAPQQVLQPAVTPLYRNVLADDRKLELLRRVWPNVAAVAFATELAEEIAYADPEQGADLILGRWPDPRRIPDAPLQLLLELGARPSRMSPYVRQSLGSLAMQQKWPELSKATVEARAALPSRELPSVLGIVAHDMLASGDAIVQSEGFELLCEAAGNACAAGELDTAASLLSAFQGTRAWTPSNEQRQASSEMMAMIESALEESDAVADWRAQQNATRYTQLIPHCENKRLIMVGFMNQVWEADIRTGLRLERLTRHESHKDKSPSADWLDGLKADTDMVAIVYQKIGHALSNKVHDHCKKRGIPVFEVKVGQRALLSALEKEFGL